jgi:hypothetical protein
MSITHKHVFDAIINDMNIASNAQKIPHKICCGDQILQVDIPIELQGEFLSLAHEELKKYNLELQCKCGISLPIPHYQILGNNEVELVCYICQLSYVNSAEIVQPQSVKKMIARFKQIPTCEHTTSKISFKTCLPPDRKELCQSCKDCLHLFENDYILCSKCNLTVYTKFTYHNTKVYCSNECMLSDNVSI